MTKIKATKPPPNKKRGVSAIHRTGPRYPLSISQYPLPEPVSNPQLRREIQKTRADHGLWAFFNDREAKKRSMTNPEDVHEHGRAWAYEELMIKGWDDLRAIWWMCLKERNWLATEKAELQRRDAGIGEAEIEERDKTVQRTMRNIRKVLTDRSSAFEEAIKTLGSAEFWKTELKSKTHGGDVLESERT